MSRVVSSIRSVVKHVGVGLQVLGGAAITVGAGVAFGWAAAAIVGGVLTVLFGIAEENT